MERLIGYIVDEDGPSGSVPEQPQQSTQSSEGSAATEEDGSEGTGGDKEGTGSSNDAAAVGSNDDDGDDSASSAAIDADSTSSTSRQFKYPFLACEIFCCEVESIFSTIIENEYLLKKLFAFLEPNNDTDGATAVTGEEVKDKGESSSMSSPETEAAARPKKLNTLLAGYFSRVAGCFILRYMPEFMQFLRANLDIIDNLIDNIENTSIAEVLMRLVGADEQTITYHGDCVQWLDETDLLRQLLAKVSGRCSMYHPHREAINASEVLVAISRTAPSSLASSLASPTSIEELLTAAVDCPSEICLTSALTVVLSVLDPRRSCMSAMQGTPGSIGHGMLTSSPPGLSGQQSQRQVQTSLAMVAAIEDLFVGRISQFVSLLKEVENIQGEMEMSYGVLRPPLGQMRLRIVEVLSMLFRTGGAKTYTALMDADTLGVLFGLMRRYPFNNFLHSEIEYIVCTIFESNNPALISHVMDDVKILSVLAEMPVTIDSKKPNTDKVVNWAAGYNGHVTRICNEIHNVAVENKTVAAAAADNEEWLSFVEKVLEPRNTKEDVQKWNCGRPARLEDNFIESDDELTFDSIGGNGRGGDDDGNVTGLPSLLHGGRYDNLDDDSNDADLSQMLDGIDDENDEDDVYFADNDAGARHGGMHATSGDGVAFGGADQGFGANFADFSFRDDSSADDDVVVVEGDDVTEVQLNVEAVMGPNVLRASTPVPTAMITNADGTAVSASSSSSVPTTSYMEKLVQGMQQTSIDGGDSRSGGGGDDGEEEVEEEAADFNTFNYWKPTYEVEVPDDA